MADTDSPSPNSALCNATAGAVAGALAATFVCPLDIIKTRLQVHGPPKHIDGDFKGSVIFASFKQIIRKDGLRGMYRGLSPTVLALLPNWALYFTIYEQCKSSLCWDDGSHLTVGANMIAAACAGGTTTVVTNPLWVVRTRLQSQGVKSVEKPYKGTFSALRRIAHEEGLRGLYSGLVPALIGTSHVAIQLPAYEQIKGYLATHDEKDKLNARDVAVASSVSKVFASTITYPHEVIRAKLQEQGHYTQKLYDGAVDCVRKVYRRDGMAGFYRGCGTNLIRTTPAAVITFTSFEMIQRLLVDTLHNDTTN